MYEFIERGRNIDSYPLADFSIQSIPTDLAITVVACAILFLNRFTRPYTIGGAVIYAVNVLT